MGWLRRNPFPRPTFSRHGSVAVRAPCALAAMEPAGVPGVDASPSALPPLRPGYCTHVPGMMQGDDCCCRDLVFGATASTGSGYTGAT